MPEPIPLMIEDRMELWLGRWFMEQMGAQRSIPLGPLGEFTIEHVGDDEPPVLVKDGQRYAIAIETIMVYKEQPDGEWRT